LCIGCALITKEGRNRMSDQSTLRQKAREAILAGKLPHRRPERMWAGPGVGSPCTICDKPVERDEIEYELDFTPDHDDPRQATPRVHLRCFAAWEFFCRYFEAAREAILTSSPMRSATHPATDGGASESN
jgi:hypothetical protein